MWRGVWQVAAAQVAASAASAVRGCVCKWCVYKSVVICEGGEQGHSSMLHASFCGEQTGPHVESVCAPSAVLSNSVSNTDIGHCCAGHRVPAVIISCGRVL